MENKKKSVISRFIAGIVIGIGGILPGVSGGIMAVAMGLYMPMLDAVYGFFKSPKKNFLFLLPLALGGAAGLIATSQLLGIMMDNYRTFVMYLFLGLVAGGIPTLYKEGTKTSGFSPRYLIATLAGALVMLALSLADHLQGGIDLSLNGWTAAMCGGIIALGVVIPGMSTSFVLMYLGLFDEMLACFNSFNIPMLLCTGAGMVVVALATIKLVKTMFDRFPSYAYFAVMGFLCTCLVMMFPGFVLDWVQLIYIALLVGGFIASRAMEKAMQA